MRYRYLQRLLLCLIFALCLQAPAGIASDQRPAVAVLNWSILETLIAMGHPPMAAADLPGYRVWVREPEVPSTVLDLGLRNQPNLALLAEAPVTDIFLTPLLASVEPKLSRLADTRTLKIYASDRPLWSSLKQLTRNLAEVVSDPEAADGLIAEVENRLDRLAGRIPGDVPPLVVVQFLDDRHVRVFGEGSLYGSTLERLGLDVGWHGTTNYWGFSLVGLEELARDANLGGRTPQLVVVEPVPPGLNLAPQDNGLWSALPSVQSYRVLKLPPVWSFGALPSARRFAEFLSRSLSESDTAASASKESGNG